MATSNAHSTGAWMCRWWFSTLSSSPLWHQAVLLEHNCLSTRAFTRAASWLHIFSCTVQQALQYQLVAAHPADLRQSLAQKMSSSDDSACTTLPCCYLQDTPWPQAMGPHRTEGIPRWSSAWHICSGRCSYLSAVLLLIMHRQHMHGGGGCLSCTASRA